ncbi:MAG TPA: ABC transporter ATP-binding protein [Pseudolabrys sp.]|nr:ABC transporter ATP-binding protein [Pseudolabrys sp.]
MTDILEISDLVAGYGEARVIDQLSLSVAEGECVAVLGRNGMGKTTLINSIVGTTTRHRGRILLRGRDVSRWLPYRRAQAGIAWVPQERNIFASLTVEENLTAVARPGRWTLRAVYDVFPRLRERSRNMGRQLSGGEQQMLAIGRALMLNNPLLLLDEPTEGLAPVIVQEVFQSVRRLVLDEGLAVIIVEHQAKKVLSISSRAIVLNRGRIAFEGVSRSLLEEPGLLRDLVGVAKTDRG